MKTSLFSVTVLLGVTLSIGVASAGWPYPDEIAVTDAYNRIWCTDYGTTQPADLDALLAERGEAMQTVWTTSTLVGLQVLVHDTSVKGQLYLDAIAPGGNVSLLLYDAGPWTAPTRGWQPAKGSVQLDLVEVLLDAGLDIDTPFKLRQGTETLGPANTVRIAGGEKGEFFLAHNDKAVDFGDADLNEPVILAVAPTAGRIETCPFGYNVIVGTDGDDILKGTQGPDCIFGLRGNDDIRGRAGDDLLFGGAGDDVLRAGGGDDVVYGGTCNDDLRGGSGNDDLYGGNGNDILRGHRGDDNLSGGEGDDELRGGKGDDWLVGQAGDDILRGHSGNDRLYGGPGVDELRGHQGDDILSGGGDDDILYGGTGADAIYGGAGNDFAIGHRGEDYLNGGAGDDDLRASGGDDQIDGGDGYDVLNGGNAVDNCYNGEDVSWCEISDLPVTEPFPADYYSYGTQGATANGGAVSLMRSDPDAGLEQTPEDVEGGFYSLGFGGSAAMFFNTEVVNGPGDDVQVWEKTYGAYPLEEAEIFAWDDAAQDWVFLGVAGNTDPSNTATTFDLGDLPFTFGILVVDITDPTPFAGSADGFDLNGVYGLNGRP